MLAGGGEHLDALLASFKREQLLRQREPPPPERPSSISAVAEQRPPLCALAEPQLLANEAATVLPRQQQHLLKQELASAQQELAVAEAAETQARRWQHEEQRQRQHGRVEAWREARDAERALGAARPGPRARALTNGRAHLALQIFSSVLWAGADRVTPPCAWPPPAEAGGFFDFFLT